MACFVVHGFDVFLCVYCFAFCVLICFQATLLFTLFKGRNSEILSRPLQIFWERVGRGTTSPGMIPAQSAR
jgi:hypothetical protein